MVHVDEGNKGNLKLHIQHIEFFYEISLTLFNFSFCKNYDINFENLQKKKKKKKKKIGPVFQDFTSIYCQSFKVVQKSFED